MGEWHIVGGMSSTPLIQSLLRASATIKSALADDAPFLGAVERLAARLRQVILDGGTIYSCGNGGSSCDAMHLTEELVARYKRERPGIRAMHFGDTGTVTCWSNDYEYESVFARYAETFCAEKDCLIAISTSGRSRSVNRAVEVAKKRGCFTAALTGKGGGELAPLVDLALVVPSEETERIQEAHITIIHILLELLETA